MPRERCRCIALSPPPCSMRPISHRIAASSCAILEALAWKPSDSASMVRGRAAAIWALQVKGLEAPASEPLGDSHAAVAAWPRPECQRRHALIMALALSSRDIAAQRGWPRL